MGRRKAEDKNKAEDQAAAGAPPARFRPSLARLSEG
jgi:hypothetical protein